jgi:hypothetical protein
MTLSAKISAALVAALTSSPDLGATVNNTALSPSFAFADGSGANQANKLFVDTRTLAASGTENLDFSGALTDPLGAAVVFTKIRALMVRAAAANTNDVVVGGLNAAAFGIITLFGDDPSSVKVKPGGLLLLVAPDANGYAVTAGTADLLKILNSAGGTGVTYDILVLGS